MSLSDVSDESINGNKKKKLMTLYEAVYSSWGTMIKYVIDTKVETAGIANLIDIVVRAHQLPFEGEDHQFTVGKLLKQNRLIDNEDLIAVLMMEHKFKFPTKSIKELLPHTSFEKLLQMDLITCDDPMFVKHILSTDDGGTALLTKMLKKSDNFGVCGRILAAFLPSSYNTLEQMLAFIKKLMPVKNIQDIQGSVDELTKKLKCSVDNKGLLKIELIKEWHLTTKGKVNLQKRKTPLGGGSNKKKTKREDKEDYIEEEENDSEEEENDSEEEDDDSEEEDDSGEEDSSEDESSEDDSGKDDKRRNKHK